MNRKSALIIHEKSVTPPPLDKNENEIFRLTVRKFVDFGWKIFEVLVPHGDARGDAVRRLETQQRLGERLGARDVRQLRDHLRQPAPRVVPELG